MLTISGGQWRGQKLKALERPDLRPTSSRVKASIFNILEALVWKRTGQPDFSDWRCLDLYAGVGGLGLEILSRGAAHCVFVEIQRAHAAVLKQNVASLGCGAQTTVLVADAEAAGSWDGMGPFDLVMLDPPYAESKLPVLLERLGSGSALKVGGIVLFEHAPELKPLVVRGLALHSHRVLGPAGISVYLRE